MVRRKELELILRKHFTRTDPNNPTSFCSFEFWRAILAEFLATCFFVLLLCATALKWSDSNLILTTIYISFTAGFTIATLVQSFGHISGGHINPAVTVAFVIVKKLPFLRGLMYILAQCLGATTGAEILYGLTTPDIRSSLGANQLNPMLSVWQGLGVEVMLTFCLVFTVFATVDQNRKELGSSSLAIGLAVLIAHLVGIPFTGTGINPARSLGPAIAINLWEHHWIYWVGPLLGGPLAGVLYEYVFDRKHKVRELKDALKDTSQICLIPHLVSGLGHNYKSQPNSRIAKLSTIAPTEPVYRL